MKCPLTFHANLNVRIKDTVFIGHLKLSHVIAYKKFGGFYVGDILYFIYVCAVKVSSLVYREGTALRVKTALRGLNDRFYRTIINNLVKLRSLGQVYTNFPKIRYPSQNSGCQKGDTK